MKYKLVCFDLDGTIVDDTVFIWQTLHDHFDTDAKARKKAADRFFRNEITYQDWVDHDVELLRSRGATKAKLTDVIRGLRLMPGARETIGELEKLRLKLAVISGSISLVIDTLFPDHPFDHLLINHFHFDEAGNLVRGEGTKYDMELKAAGLRHIAELEGFDVEECVFVGDNFNDIEVARTAGLSIAFNSKSEDLEKVCSVVIPKHERDLRSILPHVTGRPA